MAHGGKRKNAGKPKGVVHKKTLEKQVVAEVYNQRAMNAVDKLFNAQLTLALGSMKVFRIDEIPTKGGETKKVHVHVIDAEEIKNLLDEHDGNAGEVDGNYYYFQDVAPDNKAIDSILNRALGKPKDSVDMNHSGEVGTYPVTLGEWKAKATERTAQAEKAAAKFSDD